MYIAMHVLECLVLHLQQIKDYIVKFVHHGHGICIYIYIYPLTCLYSHCVPHLSTASLTYSYMSKL